MLSCDELINNLTNKEMNFREDFCKETGFDIKDLTPQHAMFKYYTYYLEDKLKQQLSINSVRHF